MEQILKKVLICILLIAFGISSFFILGDLTSDPNTYARQTGSIDEKVNTVLKLTATSTLLSAVVSTLPGDTATPIADKLADVTEYFLLILCALFAEKYMLTILGAALFKVLIPIACLLLLADQFLKKLLLRHIAIRLTLLGAALFIAIPLGLHVSDLIYDTYQGSIYTTISECEALTDESAALSGEAEAQGLIGSITQKITETTKKAADILKRFVETLAVMIVTSCVIPILILLFFLWIMKIITGANLIPAATYTAEQFRRGDPAWRQN